MGTHIADINSSTLKLEPVTYADVANIDDIFGACIPVAVFGDPVDTTAWERVPHTIIIDAAGAFLQQKHSKQDNITVCYSLHATKFVGCGEGGFVVNANSAMIKAVKELSRFGPGGGNYKMSEYHAAIALASLDYVEVKKRRTRQVLQWYQQQGLEEMFHRPVCDRSTLLVMELPEGASAERIQSFLSERAVETRQWYRPWLNERPDFICGPTPVADSLKDKLLGLPFHNFLDERDVAYVMDTYRSALNAVRN